MNIGDLIMYEGKQWILRGIDPMSVPNRRAELEDPDTGERVSVPLADVEFGEV
ncbi:MAG TPA: hypothetical protein VJZ00_18530 [Thermoanaerobaculia bacterium]|nr:hypothetical protein [Thermoanaerobaculia bacterium]